MVYRKSKPHLIQCGCRVPDQHCKNKLHFVRFAFLNATFVSFCTFGNSLLVKLYKKSMNCRFWYRRCFLCFTETLEFNVSLDCSVDFKWMVQSIEHFQCNGTFLFQRIQSGNPFMYGKTVPTKIKTTVNVADPWLSGSIIAPQSSVLVANITKMPRPVPERSTPLAHCLNACRG